MTQSALAPLEDFAPLDAIEVKLRSLLSQAAFALNEASEIDLDAKAPDGRISAPDAAYSKQLAITGLARLKAFCRLYMGSPEYLASQGSDGFDRPIVEAPAVNSELLSCAAVLADCDVLGPAAAPLARCLRSMADYSEPARVDEVEVHAHASENMLRAKRER